MELRATAAAADNRGNSDQPRVLWADDCGLELESDGIGPPNPMSTLMLLPSQLAQIDLNRRRALQRRADREAMQRREANRVAWGPSVRLQLAEQIFA